MSLQGSNQARDAGKQIAICADDFGINAAVDNAIVELAGQGRLTATSVLVDSNIDAGSLQALQQLDVDIGLHLNFTEALGDLSANDVMPLGPLIMRAHLRKLPSHWVLDSIERQLRKFEDLFGRSPDYVDGHLHIHQLPQIREALEQRLAPRNLPDGFWVRDTRPGSLRGSPWSERFKATVIGCLGMRTLAREANNRGWGTNRGFFGVYDFEGSHRPFECMIDQWVRVAGTGALVMTHPANQTIPGDPVGTARVAERAVLGSEAFADKLHKQQASLVRLTRVCATLP